MLDAPRPWFEAPIFLIPVTAFATALVAEPLKNAVSNRVKRRQLRRIVLMEIMWNLHWLDQGVDWLAPTGKGHFGDAARRASSRTAYENCQREFYLYYQLPEHEWIDGFFSTLEKITVLELDFENLPECGGLARQLVEQCVEYLQRHPATWGVIGADAPLFLQERIKPTLRIKSIKAWRELKSDLRELRSRAESEDDGD
jgi:hypothetical protein